MVRAILSVEGRLVDHVCNDGTTAFAIAVGSRNFEVVGLLLRSDMLELDSGDLAKVSDLTKSVRSARKATNGLRIRKPKR